MQECDSIIIKKNLQTLFSRIPSLKSVSDSLQEAVKLLYSSISRQGTLFICGNGGSAADAEHIVGELLKGFLSGRPLPESMRKRITDKKDDKYGQLLASGLQQGIRAVSLTGHPALSTAVANDNHPDLIFAQQLYALGKMNDVLMAISTSGNARNVILAARIAEVMGIPVIGLTGASGGELGKQADITIKVPAEETYLVQELHLPVYHFLCAVLEEIMI